MANDVTFVLGYNEAMVLSDMLSRFEEHLCEPLKASTLDIRDAAESVALLRLHGVFERTLVDLFAPNYSDLVKAAHDHLMP